MPTPTATPSAIDANRLLTGEELLALGDVGPAELVQGKHKLSGGKRLPGFRVALAELFTS
jgi:hypothetical protein